MASIASVGGSSSLTKTDAIGSYSPASTSLGFGSADTLGSFTAFPAHYGAFGNSDKGFGTPGIQNGQLTILPQASSSGLDVATLGAAVLNGATAAAQRTAGDPPANSDPPAGPGDPTATTHGADPPKDPPAKLPPKDPPAGPPPQPSQPHQNPFNGLTEQQQTSDELGLLDTRFRISAANSVGDTAAVTQLTPTATALNGALQNQTFPGLGVSPPKPFSLPEIPRVFLSTTA